MIERIEPPWQAEERTVLDAFLDYYRATLLMKADGLTDDQARIASVEPSILSIAGLLRHMAEVERHWFQMWLRGDDVNRLFWSDQDPDADMHVEESATIADTTALYQREVAESRSIAAGFTLDDVTAHASVHPDKLGQRMNLRWIMVHMIEEYARHAGHVDFIRERIDGATGK